MDVNNDNNNERTHQEEEEEEEEELPQLPQPRIVVLSPEGQQIRSILATKPDELPLYFINQINELMNDIAAVGDFLPKIRTSIVDDLFINEEQHRREQQQQKHGLIMTIVHKDWHKIEKQYETAFRFFLGVLHETWHGIYPLQAMAMRKTKDSNYNLRLVSLIPLVVKLGIDLQQLDEEEQREGLLSLYPSGRSITLQQIIWYERNEHTTNTTDECYSAVVERLRKKNLLVKGDIQQYNLFGKLCMNYKGPFLESRFHYLIVWNPMTLSLPCMPEKGSWLPIHWSTSRNKNIQVFNFLLKAEMKYFPEKFGFVFCKGTHRNSSNGKVFRSIPFQRACE